MNITINEGRRDEQQNVPLEIEADSLFIQYDTIEQAEFVGRLINLLAEKGVITVQEAGNLFFEDWS